MNKPVQTSSSITRKLQVVFAISILILLVSSYASYYSNRKLIESSQLVNHTNQVIASAESLISIVKDAETGQRGYVITRDVTFLQPYTGAYERAGATFSKLKELTADNPVQQRNLDRAKVAIDQRFAQLRRVLEQAQGATSRENESLVESSHTEMLKGKLIMDDLRAVVGDIRNEENRLLHLRLSEQQTFIKYTPSLVIAAALISFLISILAYFRIKADLDERMAKQKEDEAKYEETSRRISIIEGVTQQIAMGNLAARSADNATDELGRISAALNDMAQNLERNFADLERHNWLQAGALKLADSIRGERYVKNVATKVLNGLVAYTDAVVGAMYILNRDMTMSLESGFALSDAPMLIKAGVGLAGQAIQNREMIITSELPADYLRITSSTGSTKPAYLVILPLIYGEDVIGVVELGKLARPSGKEIEFLKGNANSISVGINTAISYERIQDLLEETQAQTEELQAQHNELENINTELEAQTEKLQASEEELKVQQEELQQANQELEERSRLLEEKNQEILEKNFDVQKKSEELAISTKYKSEFLANMSHELRTPLNSILLLSRLLAENGEANLNDDQVEYAKVILSSGNGLLALIDEILDLSKIEAGKMLLEYERIQVTEIVGDMKALFDPVAREKGVDLLFGDDSEGATIETDKMRLEQVLKNLLSNALKFTQQGKVELKISKIEEERISFSVSDTGVGIAADKQRQIFEAFQQADGSTRRKYGGTGLGLSISKELTKLLGGSIEVESEPGKGSTFTVTVPTSKYYITHDEDIDFSGHDSVEESRIEEDEVPISVNAEYLSTTIPENIPDDRDAVKIADRCMLIIEDDVNFAKALLEFTRKKGYKGIVAVRGDEGISLARQFKPAGILLDIQLPVKSGWEVMDELKKDAALRHIPVHMMSSFARKNESLMKGAVDFINKPVAFEKMGEIFAKIESVLSKGAKKVLIVEENTKHANALAYFLSTYNINSEIKTSVPDTVNAIREDVDCVILDMQVPGQSAYDTLEEVKRTPELESLPVIVFTGKSLSMTEEQRIKYYADSIVVKTANSYQRVLDEVSLFLHLMEESKATQQDGNKNASMRKLGALQDVLRDKSVLIVDDDVRNIFSLTKALEKYGMNIYTAIDGKEAMEVLNENRKMDIVLLDMMMPGMDGYETATAIRKTKEWKRLPIIAVTAKAMMGDREKCINAGASDYITKPVDIDQLLSLLRVWLYDKI